MQIKNVKHVWPNVEQLPKTSSAIYTKAPKRFQIYDQQYLADSKAWVATKYRLKSRLQEHFVNRNIQVQML